MAYCRRPVNRKVWRPLLDDPDRQMALRQHLDDMVHDLFLRTRNDPNRQANAVALDKVGRLAYALSTLGQTALGALKAANWSENGQDYHATEAMVHGLQALCVAAEKDLEPRKAAGRPPAYIMVWLAWHLGYAYCIGTGRLPTSTHDGAFDRFVQHLHLDGLTPKVPYKHLGNAVSRLKHDQPAEDDWEAIVATHTTPYVLTHIGPPSKWLKIAAFRVV
jgi:hypothetical protein